MVEINQTRSALSRWVASAVGAGSCECDSDESDSAKTWKTSGYSYVVGGSTVASVKEAVAKGERQLSWEE